MLSGRRSRLVILLQLLWRSFVPPVCCLLLTFLLAGLLPCAAREANRYIVQTTRLTVEDGLISNTVLCGLQDSYGFIWFGTPEGLQRYDGRSFRLFNKEKGGLPINKVGCMAEDRDGRLWLLYGSGEDRLTAQGRITGIMELRSNGVVPLAKAFGTRLPFPEDDVKWLWCDERRNLFLISGHNEVWWYRGGGHFKKLLAGRPGLEFFPHSSLYQAHGGSIWLSAGTHLLHLDTLGRATLTAYPAGTVLNVFRLLPDGSCQALSERQRLHEQQEEPGVRHIGTDGRISPTGIRFSIPIAHPKGDDYLIEYRADPFRRNVILHNPHIGLQLITDSSTILLIDTATLAEESPLSPYAYFTDAGGGHWLCSSLGIFRFGITPAYFTNYLTRAQLPAATAVTNQVRGIWDDGAGQVYIGRDGLFRLSDSGRRTDRLTVSPTVLVQGDGDELWYSNDQQLYRMPRDGSHPVVIRNTTSPDRVTWSFYRSRSGRRYVGGDHFIGYIRADSIVSLPPCAGAPSQGSCYQFFEDGAGRLWAVTDGGLFEVRNDCYVPYGRDARQLPSSRLHYIHVDRQGAWWLCTAGDGLIRWEPATGRRQRFGMEQGLPSNVLYALLEDARGLFWISSNNGLIRFDPVTHGVRIFTRKDGLPHTEFDRISFHQAPGGRLYFGGVNGVSAFDPLQIPVGSQVNTAPLRILSLQQYNEAAGKPVDKTGDLLRRGHIRLSPGERFMTLEVALLDFMPGPHRYGYRINAGDTTWHYSGDGAIHLDNLPYGRYLLRVRGQSPAGVWSEEELRIPVQVVAPFYRTLPFILALILLGGCILWAVIRARIRILKRSNVRLEKMVRQRTHELQDLLARQDMLMKEIHHRVKNNLQVIGSLMELQAVRLQDPAVRAALAASQSRVMSIALVHQKLYQHDRPDTVEFSSFAQDLFEQLTGGMTDGQQEIELRNGIPKVYFDINTAVPLGLALSELITNSLKYAAPGNPRLVLSLQLTLENGQYCLEYGDNGPGMDPALFNGRGKTLGLHLIRRLSKQIRGAAGYRYDAGSRFSIHFPEK